MSRYITLVFFAGMVVMNYLATALPLNNKTTGQLSDNLPNLFVPAGITFTIWGVIYLLLAVYCVVQFTGQNQFIMARVSWLFSISCILNALWIVCWHYEKLPLSLLVMAFLLLFLIIINTVISDEPPGILKAAFGVYLGWICIATIANVTALLVHYKWNGFGISEEVWTIIMITTGTLIVIMAIFRMKNPFIGLAVIWAFIGIIIKRQNDYRSIVLVAAIGIVLVSFVTILTFTKKYRQLI